jgi:hypothetical protein
MGWCKGPIITPYKISLHALTHLRDGLDSRSNRLTVPCPVVCGHGLEGSILYGRDIRAVLGSYG